RMPPLPADFIHARACKLKCEKILTRPTNQVGGAFVREKLVAKCYLCAKTAGPLTLEYYLLVSPLVEELEIYGVKIVEKRSGVVAIAPGLTTSGRKILHLIDLLSKGTVTPTSLADIVEDWL
ncbi:DUF6514 family protein, partial [Flavonifractor plautii]|uniref:DUF6514 family protein n=1 Tax=Flavonifractor plautii TaxID=292800 RepID=UPI001FA94B84